MHLLIILKIHSLLDRALMPSESESESGLLLEVFSQVVIIIWSTMLSVRPCSSHIFHSSLTDMSCYLVMLCLAMYLPALEWLIVTTPAGGASGRRLDGCLSQSGHGGEEINLCMPLIKPWLSSPKPLTLLNYPGSLCLCTGYHNKQKLNVLIFLIKIQYWSLQSRG
jgi:hypothetical protein